MIKLLDTVEVGCHKKRAGGPASGLMGSQTDSYIYIATERLTPLGWHVRRKSLSVETLKWGLYSVAVRKALDYSRMWS